MSATLTYNEWQKKHAVAIADAERNCLSRGIKRLGAPGATDRENNKILSTFIIKRMAAEATESKAANSLPPLDDNIRDFLRMLAAKADIIDGMDVPMGEGRAECEFVRRLKALLDVTYGQNTSQEIFIDDKNEKAAEAQTEHSGPPGEAVVASPGYATMSLEEREEHRTKAAVDRQLRSAGFDRFVK